MRPVGLEDGEPAVAHSCFRYKWQCAECKGVTAWDVDQSRRAAIHTPVVCFACGEGTPIELRGEVTMILFRGFQSHWRVVYPPDADSR